ncbi:MAG: polynucleotide adenylyltransferase PcnB [Gammaproteobacteria bacterium]|nr:polynucleotide adenylyltransferase PcnB [Gammaproteobacteria bacterium]
MPDLYSLPGIDHAIIIPRKQHNISRQAISPNALKVLYRLNKAGFTGFLVGGSVRDLLLGKSPKDFDIATDASPEEIRQIFRNSRIIGRRFKIVHVRFGREIIEVTTFRAHHEASNRIDKHVPKRKIRGLDSAHTNEGMILRDNVYGSIDEDSLRRDFTVNALYYTPNGFSVLDFNNGMQDIVNRQIRIIGDPVARYREDPVRMLRAIRFAAKLDFDIEQDTAAPIQKLGDLLLSIAPARLYDEILKLFYSGHAVKIFEMLKSSGLGQYLIAPTLESIECCPPAAAKMLHLALENTDQRIADSKSVSPHFLFAALLWPLLCRKREQAKRDNQDQRSNFLPMANQVISTQLAITAIPRRVSYASRDIWEMQWKLEHPTRRNALSTLNHTCFRAAYDFLLLREAAGEDLGRCGQWWTDFQLSDTNQQEKTLESLSNPRRRRRQRNKGRKKINPGTSRHNHKDGI